MTKTIKHSILRLGGDERTNFVDKIWFDEEGKRQEERVFEGTLKNCQLFIRLNI